MKMKEELDAKTGKLLLDALTLAKKESEALREKDEAKIWTEMLLPLTLEQALVRLTKTELGYIRQILDLSGLSKLKKQELVRELVRLIPAKAEMMVFCSMDDERYRLIQKICANGGFIYVDNFDTDKASYLHKIGVIFAGSYKGRKILAVPDEIAAVFRKIDGPELAQIVERNTEWVTLVQGLLYYYGVLTLEQIQMMLGKLDGREPELIELFDVIKHADLYYGHTHFDYDLGFYDERVFNPAKVVQEQKARPSLDYYPFTKSYLLKVGKPGHRDRTPAQKHLIDLLVRYFEVTPIEADEMVGNGVTIVNMVEKPTELIEFFTAQLEPPSVAVLQQLVNALMEFMNTTRQWILKGHTPAELVQEEKKYLRPLPTKPFILGQPKGQPKGKVIDMPKRTKVGRNAPCPCGSGKKYKHCCGKNH